MKAFAKVEYKIEVPFSHEEVINTIAYRSKACRNSWKELGKEIYTYGLDEGNPRYFIMIKPGQVVDSKEEIIELNKLEITTQDRYKALDIVYFFKKYFKVILKPDWYLQCWSPDKD